jgi:hypothetical protein
MINDIESRISCAADVFWAEVAPYDHLIQIYEEDEVMLDSLEGFVSSGFRAGDSVIIIATAEHLKSLEIRLRLHGFDLETLMCTDQYIPLHAEETLSKFMLEGWPDEKLFMHLVKGLIPRARGDHKRKVRAYGEMVSILWGRGYNAATVQLEHLWNKFCATESFCLFCAYPKIGFRQDANTSIMNICSTHSRVIAGDTRSTTEVFFSGSA